MDLSYPIILLILSAIIIAMAIFTDLLRNTVFDQAVFNALAKTSNPKPAFSLAKTQLAFWTVIVIGSYIYVAFFSSPLNLAVDIKAVNLTLLGIAAGTTVVGKAIDGSQQNNDTASSQSAQQNHPSKGFFFFDIISDETGVSIHRLQNVLWTIVVGAVYIIYVAKQKQLQMPDEKVITPVLLGLMSVSAAGYLGVKTTENKAPQPQPQPNPNPNPNPNPDPNH